MLSSRLFFMEVLIYSEWQHKYANFSCSKEKNRRNRIQSAASQRTALRYFKIFRHSCGENWLFMQHE